MDDEEREVEMEAEEETKEEVQEEDGEDEEEQEERDGRGNRAGVVQSEASTGGAEYLRPLPRVTSCDSPHPRFSAMLESPPPPASTTTFFLLLHLQPSSATRRPAPR